MTSRAGSVAVVAAMAALVVGQSVLNISGVLSLQDQLAQEQSIDRPTPSPTPLATPTSTPTPSPTPTPNPSPSPVEPAPVEPQFTPVPGPTGPAGRDGQDGVDGQNGTDGTDGQDGVDGPPGPVTCPEGSVLTLRKIVSAGEPVEAWICVLVDLNLEP